MNIKRWLICAFLFLVCFLFLRWLNNGKIIEGHGGGGGHGGGRGLGHGNGGNIGYYGGNRRYRGTGYYYGGTDTTPLYVYEEVDPYWYRYIPFFGY
jgi:hypothetical protein